jgi:hypothetical protein
MAMPTPDFAMLIRPTLAMRRSRRGRGEERRRDSKEYRAASAALVSTIPVCGLGYQLGFSLHVGLGVNLCANVFKNMMLIEIEVIRKEPLSFSTSFGQVVFKSRVPTVWQIRFVPQTRKLTRVGK